MAGGLIEGVKDFLSFHPKKETKKEGQKPLGKMPEVAELRAERREKEAELNESEFIAELSAECVGKVEEFQDWETEDRLVALHDGRVVAVFDGLDSETYKDDDGHIIYRNHGYKASEAASKSFAESYRIAQIAKTQEDAERAMQEAMYMANARVRLEKTNSPEDKIIGTTFVGAEIWRDKNTGESMLTVGNSGDSMAYLYRENKLERISKEHSFVNYLNGQFELGIDDQSDKTFAMTLGDYVRSKNIPESDHLLKVLKTPVRKDEVTGNMRTAGETTIGNLRNITIGGLVGREMKPDEKMDEREMSIKTIKLKKGDKILMCSDGLSDSTSDREIEKIIRDYESMGTETVKQALVEHGVAAQTDKKNMRANKKDDVTVAWIDFQGFEEPEQELGVEDLEEVRAA